MTRHFLYWLLTNLNMVGQRVSIQVRSGINSKCTLWVHNEASNTPLGLSSHVSACAISYVIHDVIR